MEMLTLFIIVFLSNSLSSEFDFPKLLKRDKENLRSNHHAGRTDFLKRFDQFIDFNPSTSKYMTFYVRKQRLEKWVPKSGPIKSIIKVRIVTAVDTAQFIRNDITLNARIRNSKFVFNAYKFITNTNYFTYITIDSEGLIEYDIDNREFSISYESIALGVNYYDTLQNLKSVLNDSKCR